MKKIVILALMTLLYFQSAFAANYELDDGSYVDEYGEVTDNKFENAEMFAPWNDPMMQDDPFAPWNDPMANERDANNYLRDNNVDDSEYYWK